ncbi:hypothetical protein F4678DRAFT_330923 [Xylaria arbuscula]|nr:hypothetical protein F4678DRAFT_330923 [Xylaria arbuscula]
MASLPIIDIDPLAPPPPRIIDDGSLRRRVATPRPKGVHTKHLTELDRFRVRTLYYDACLSKGRIRQITGYSASQIRTAVRAPSSAVGKRPGRPKETKKRGSRSSNAKSSSPNESDVNAELIQQAHDFFARGSHMGTGEDDDDDGESDDEGDEDDAPPIASTQHSTPPPLAPLITQTSTAISSPSVAAGGPLTPIIDRRGTTFSDLPPDVRIHIWRCVLSAAPTQTAPSRSWALAVLPAQPWLELGMSPPSHVKLENPPWGHYVDTRHVPATVLTRVNRESRKTVLERCTPIAISKTTRESSKGIPQFIWIDRYSDVIHFFGEPFRHELFDMAGKSACPELYR